MQVAYQNAPFGSAPMGGRGGSRTTQRQESSRSAGLAASALEVKWCVGVTPYGAGMGGPLYLCLYPVSISHEVTPPEGDGSAAETIGAEADSWRKQLFPKG